MTDQEILELLAEIEHNQWCDWSKELVKTEMISSKRKNRWRTLWKPYEQLTEEEKEMDRFYARKILQLLENIAKE